MCLDGPLNLSWADNFSSVLDVNKVLNLGNGDKLHLTNNVKILFETGDLSAASPAIVARTVETLISFLLNVTQVVLRNSHKFKFMTENYVIHSCVVTLHTQQSYDKIFRINICLTSVMRAKCGIHSTLCWKIPNISGSIELFAL